MYNQSCLTSDSGNFHLHTRVAEDDTMVKPQIKVMSTILSKPLSTRICNFMISPTEAQVST